MFSSSVRAVLFALAASAVTVNAAPSLISSGTPSLTLKVSGPESVNTVENLKVTATLTNTGDETIKLLNDPLSPLSKLPAETFKITSEATGVKPSFTGARVKYVPGVAAANKAYTILAPGQSIEVEHDLSTTYNFAAAGEGTYSFEARNMFYLVDDSLKITPIYANAEAHSAHVSGKLAVARPNVQKRATFNGCSSSEQSSLVSAASAAQNYAAGALSYLQSHTSSTSRFTTWFGTFTSSRHSTALSHFSNISGNTFSSYSFDCTCTDAGTYAYVFPDQFGQVFLCGAFWSAPTTGTDSKGGTLIHESSHFDANAGTQDYVYGQSGAQSLAKSDPDEAVFNADNHEYFAENNPALS